MSAHQAKRKRAYSKRFDIHQIREGILYLSAVQNVPRIRVEITILKKSKHFNTSQSILSWPSTKKILLILNSNFTEKENFQVDCDRFPLSIRFTIIFITPRYSPLFLKFSQMLANIIFRFVLIFIWEKYNDIYEQNNFHQSISSICNKFN